jgi:hypothetical protein
MRGLVKVVRQAEYLGRCVSRLRPEVGIHRHGKRALVSLAETGSPG